MKLVPLKRVFLENLKFCPYKISVVQNLQPADTVSRFNFHNWILRNIHESTVDPQLLFMVDKAWFHLNDYTNTSHWNAKNSTLFTISHYMTRKLVYSVLLMLKELSHINILEPFCDELTEKEMSYMYFHQDTAHHRRALQMLHVPQK
jgi:hypothetical protein